MNPLPTNQKNKQIKKKWFLNC